MSFSTPPPPPPPSGPPPPPAGGPPSPPPPPGGYGAGGYGSGGPGAGGYGAGGWSPAGPKPPNYLVWAILTTLFCCLPFGVVSIVFAAQVDSKYNSGDAAGARRASDNAKKWAIISAVVGLAAVVVWFVFVVSIGASFS